MDLTAIVILVAVIAAFLLLRQLGLVSPAAARTYFEQGAMVIDVRTPGEYQARHLPDAVNIPLDAIREEIGRRVTDKSKVLLLHCVSGTRSGIAKRMLRNSGYARTYNLGSYGRAERILSSAGR